MSGVLSNVQRLVLRGGAWAHARHWVVEFPPDSHPLHWLSLLRPQLWPTPADAKAAHLQCQVSLGFSRRGLEHAQVPRHILSLLALKAPAFSAGAAVRASRALGATGAGVPSAWDPAFAFQRLDAVLSGHANDEHELDALDAALFEAARQSGVRMVGKPLRARRLAVPPAAMPVPHGVQPQWVHFGFRDGLSRMAIRGCSSEQAWNACKPSSRHEPGEFLLGHPQDPADAGAAASGEQGANPWIAGPGLRVWPEPVRRFFRDGSFGVLHRMEQDAAGFEAFVQQQVKPLRMDAEQIKAKLCGRFPDGRPLAAPGQAPEDDFDYRGDERGEGCPFGSHVRRMNPRGGELAHTGRGRPLIRRGMPYGRALWEPPAPQEPDERGLMGQFFCASIEDQFEHLLGQWADRVPLGSGDLGTARDPLIGAHEGGDGPFLIPQANGLPPKVLRGLRAFTQTRGMAYLFYPSLSTLQGMADSKLWRPDDEDWA